MAGRQWYTAIDGKQGGPFTDERLREMISIGAVRADTLVWCDGMSAWTRAGEIPGLTSALRSGPPLASAPPPIAPGATAADVATAGPLSTTVRVWPLFGRVLLIILADITIIPLPWVMPSIYGWFVDHLQVPGGQRVRFAGKPGDIWYIFILSGLCGYVGLLGHSLNLLILPLTVLFLVIIVRWFWRNLVWEGQTAPLSFTGGYWAWLGWYVLTILSIITIIGWAWVCTAWIRWMCRHVEGSARQLVFTAGGWAMLWRTILFVLSCVFIVPIPWTFHWYTCWLVSQCALAGSAAPAVAPA
jgi:hypothetical protein